MQSAIFEPNNLPELESAGAISRAFFEEPMMGVVGVCVIGVVVFFALKSRGKVGRGLLALVAGIVLAGVMLGTSALVTTDREVISRRAADLVSAVATGDRGVMQSLLDPDVSLETRFVSARGADRIVELVGERVPGLVEEYSILEVRADLPGARVGRTMVKVRVQGSYAPASSWWMVLWERSGVKSDDWVATHIEPIWIQGINRAGG